MSEERMIRISLEQWASMTDTLVKLVKPVPKENREQIKYSIPFWRKDFDDLEPAPPTDWRPACAIVDMENTCLIDWKECTPVACEDCPYRKRP